MAKVVNASGWNLAVRTAASPQVLYVLPGRSGQYPSTIVSAQVLTVPDAPVLAVNSATGATVAVPATGDPGAAVVGALVWSAGTLPTLTLSANTLVFEVPQLPYLTPLGISLTLSGFGPQWASLTDPLTTFTPVPAGTQFGVQASWAGGLQAAPAPFVFPDVSTVGGAVLALDDQDVPYQGGYWFRSLLRYSVGWAAAAGGGTTLKLTFVLPPPVGYTFQTFGVPPPLGSAAPPQGAPPGFYRLAPGQPSTAALVPGALFRISNQAGTQVASRDWAKIFTMVPRSSDPTAMAAQTFTFAFCGPSGPPVLLNVTTGEASGFVAFVPPVNRQMHITDVTGGSWVPWPGGAACGGGSAWNPNQPVPAQCGVAQVYGGGGAVVLLTGDVTAGTPDNAAEVNLLQFPVKGAPALPKYGLASVQLFDPPGFVGGSDPNLANPQLAVYLDLLTTEEACALGGSVRAACWSTSPYGCAPIPGALPVCALQATEAGARTCGACGVADPGAPAYTAAASQFLSQVCLFQHQAASTPGLVCAPVAGTAAPDACTGFRVPGLGPSCVAACEAVGPAACNSLTADYCGQATVANSADCACLNVETSSFPAAAERGMSFPGLQAYLLDKYGLGGAVQLQPKCWWPTCAADNTGAILPAAGAGGGTSCPAKVIQCSIDVENVIARDSTVGINIVQDCGFDTSSALACSSSALVALLGPQGVGGGRRRGGGGGGGPALASSSSSSGSVPLGPLGPWVLPIALGALIIVLLVVGAVLHKLAAGRGWRRPSPPSPG